MPNGNVYLAWLDHRGKDRSGAGAIFAASRDHGKTLGVNRTIDGMACLCCRPIMALAPDGGLWVAWRKTFEGNVRDVVLAQSHGRVDTSDMSSSWAIALRSIAIQAGRCVEHGAMDEQPKLFFDLRRLRPNIVFALYTAPAAQVHDRSAGSTSDRGFRVPFDHIIDSLLEITLLKFDVSCPNAGR
ncbi:MAG: exo-alpha-sialidase [Nitrospira sp.]|nr:exo-alpha-sialidase [Nitrospira sp.]